MSMEFAEKAKKLKLTKEKINSQRHELFKTINEEPSMTKQEFTQECNVNRIVNKFVKTGQIPYQDGRIGMYSDVSNLPDYKSSLEFVIQARETFDNLPVDVRNRFSNSPQKLIEFLENPENIDEARKLGLAKPERPSGSSEPTNPEPVPPTSGDSAPIE